MNILFLDQFSELGGAQHALLDTVQVVQRNGWHAHALLPGRGPLGEILQSWGVPADEIPSGPYHTGSKTVVDSVRFALDVHQQVRTINALLARRDFDLIYVNGPRLLPAAALASRKRARIVFHAHSHVYGIAARLLREAIRRAGATVVACSNSVLDPLRRSIRSRNTHVIPNGVRDAGYRERGFGRNEDFRIGMIGRVAPDKGQMEFAEAAALLAPAFPGARFTICGATLLRAPSAYLSAVRQASRDLPIEFLPWQNDVSRVLHDLDLLVVPSKREGMARIIVEAFSAGVPVVAFPAGGIPEVIVDSQTGFLTREFSVQALASCIREGMQAPERLRRVASNARQAWERLYTIAAYQERISRLLEEVLEPRASGSPPECETATLQPRT